MVCKQTSSGDSPLAFVKFVNNESNKPGPFPARCPSHYPPPVPLFSHSSKILDNLSLQAKLPGCKIDFFK